MIRKIHFYATPILAITLVSLTGCVSNSAVTDNNASVKVAGYTGTARNHLEENGEIKVNRDDLHELLVVGKAFHDAGMWAESNDVLNSASEKLMWKEDSIDTPEEALRFVGTTVTNDTLADYTGRIYEGMMLDYYIAMNSLMLGEENLARVSFNRLEQRQGNAEIQLQAYTRSLQNADTDPEDSDDRELVNNTLEQASDSEFDRGLQNLPANLNAAQIRSPSGDLVNAIFRQTSSADQDRKSDKTKNAIASVQSRAPDDSSRRFAGNLEQAFKNLKDEYVFIVYEDGVGPSINEFRIDLPLALVSDDLLYAGVALPEFVPGSASNKSITISQGDNQSSTVLVTDLNRLASLEFQSSYDAKVKKEVASAVIKTVAQIAANRAIDEETSDNPLAGLLMKVAVAGTAAALTQADTRHWNNLPNHIQLGMMKKKANVPLTLTSATGQYLAKAPYTPGHQLIYVRQQTVGGDVKVFSQRLPARENAMEIATNWAPAE